MAPFNHGGEQANLQRYWDALVTNAPPDELARLAAPLDPSLIDLVTRIRTTHRRRRPDPGFVARLELNAMEALIQHHGAPIPLRPNMDTDLPPRRPAGTRPTAGWDRTFPALRRRSALAFGHVATAALLVVTLLGGYALYRSAGPLTQDAPGQFADVPTFKVNPAHTGENPGPGPTGKPVERWRLDTKGDVRWSPAIVAGVLHVGAGDGVVYALDPATGAVRWTFATGGPIAASPTVADGVVFIGSEDRTLYALDAATGAERWRLADAGVNVGTVVVDGTLYVGADAGLLALDAASGTERWRFAAGGPVVRAPAVVDGVVYTGSTDGQINALDSDDGAVIWRYQTDGGRMTTPTVAGGIVYQATLEGPADRLYAIDAATGSERWRFALGPAAVLVPTVGGGMAYVPTFDRALYALDAASGTLRWRFATDRDITANPALVGDTLYVAGQDGNLYALAAADGSERWRVAVGESGAGAVPVVTGGMIYVPTLGGALVALGDPIAAPGGATPATGGRASTPATAVAAGPVAYVEQITGGATPLAAPHDLALGADGNLYVADEGLDRVVVFAPDGSILRTWGGNGMGDGLFLDPSAIGLDTAGNVYVSDNSRHDIQKFAPDGTFLLRWGGRGSGEGQLEGPGVTVDDQDRVWVVDNGNHRIQVFDTEGTLLFTFGGLGRGDGQFTNPNALTFDAAGNIYVVECGNPRVSKFSPDLAFVMSWDHDFRCLAGIEIDAQDRVYVADADNSRIQVFDTNGTFLTMWGEAGTGEGQLTAPLGLAFDGAGHVYVVDIVAGRITKFRLLPPLAPTP